MKHFVRSRKFFLVLFVFLWTWYRGLEWQTHIYENNVRGSAMAACNAKDAMDAHAAEIMKIQGVVGVYTGALEDGTPCIKVMVTNKTKELEEKIPHYLEGCPVIIEETGEIKPYSN